MNSIFISFLLYKMVWNSLRFLINRFTVFIDEQKSSQISSLEEANTELESKQQGMIRNFDLHKNKVRKPSKWECFQKLVVTILT